MVSSEKKVGYLYSQRYFDEADSHIVEALKDAGPIVLLPIEQIGDIDILQTMSKECNVIFNYCCSGNTSNFALEVAKTLEFMGKRVVSSSSAYYYSEEKWMFYNKCKKINIPVPNTHLVTGDSKYELGLIEQWLEQGDGSLIIKSIYSQRGEAVERVKSYKEFKEKSSMLLSKDPSSPLIIQEFIPNDRKSYRITLINYEVVQGVVKHSNSWKQTGDNDSEVHRLFEVDSDLSKLCKHLATSLGIEVCGIDLMKTPKGWVVLEANSSPGFEFVKHDTRRLVEKLAQYLNSL